MHISQSSSTASLRIYLLGAFRLVVESRTIAADQWKLRKAKRIIKLLALAPQHRLHREQLIDFLWPDRSLSAAANNLHQTLYIARRILDPQGAHASQYLAWHDDFLSLCPNDPLWIDVEAFEVAAQQARRSQAAAAYHSALDLYRGELLPEDRYEDWAAARREALRRLYLSLLGGLATLYEAREQPQQAGTRGNWPHVSDGNDFWCRWETVCFELRLWLPAGQRRDRARGPQRTCHTAKDRGRRR